MKATSDSGKHELDPKESNDGGYEPARGTYEEALEMVGYATEPVRAEVPIEWGQIKAFSGLLEDPNPSYWRPDVAEKLWGSIIAPPGMLMSLFASLHWHPDGLLDKTVLGLLVPLPGSTLINASTETTFYRPLHLGDWITVVESVTSVSPEKATRLGVGHFVTTTATYHNGTGEKVAENVNNLFRYTPHEGKE